MQSIILKNNGLSNLIIGNEFDFHKDKNSKNFNRYIHFTLSKMNIDPCEIYFANQIHGNNIEYCNGKTGIKNFVGKFFEDTDGLITNIPNIALLITFADCTPIVLFDPINKVQCVIHSGWKSTVKKIVGNGINKMIGEFDCKKENILVYLGPSIDINNYEVGVEVYEAFKHFNDREKFFKKNSSDKYQLSVIDANYYLLLELGIKKENIEICRDSTYTSNLLHSARKEGENYMLNSIITMINN